ncbi:MAG: hypothetical protein JNK82_37275 [Myxococcaceae bacterium]|nr:hypothetical protein [Myxococcaceae bacterium]
MPRFLPLVFSLASAAAFAADAPLPPLEVNTRAVPTKARLGEPFTIEVVLTHVKEQRYDLQPPASTDDFDVVDVARSRADGPDSATTTFKVQMVAFQLGKLTSPPLTFDVWAAQAQGTFSVPGTEVELVSSLPPDADQTGAGLYDINPPLDVAVRTWRLLYALAIAIAVALGAYAVMRWLKRPKAVIAEAPKPLEALEVRAKRALDALRAEDLPGKARVREYYFRLSEIVRSYLGERYGFDALESTSPELLESLRRLHTPGLPLKELQEFVNESDFVRYAKATVDPNACKNAIELAYHIVHATTPSASPTPHAQLRVS